MSRLVLRFAAHPSFALKPAGDYHLQPDFFIASQPEELIPARAGVAPPGQASRAPRCESKA